MIKYVRYNLKGVQGEQALLPLTVVTGDSRTGKTTLLDAIRLAVQGPGVLGTEVNELATKGANAIHTVVLDEEDHKAELRIPIEDGKVKTKSAEHNSTMDPSWLSMTAFGDVDSYGDSKMRSAIVAAFGKGIEVKAPEALSEMQQKLWDECVEEAGGDSGLDALAELESTIRKRKLALGRQIKSLESVEEPERPVDLDVAAEQAEILRLQKAAKEQALANAEANKPELSFDETMAAKRIEDINKLYDLLGKVYDSLALLQPDAEGPCPMCEKGHLSEPTKRAEALKETMDHLLLARAEQQERVKSSTAYNRHIQAIEALKQRPPEGYTSDEVQLRQAGLRQHLEVVADYNAYLKARKEILKLTEQRDCYAALEKEAKRVAKDAIETVKTRAEECVNTYLPNDTAKLQLSSKQCRWLMQGADGEFHQRSLSGSERSALRKALILGTSKGVEKRILLIEGEEELAAMDSDRAMKYLESLAALQEAGLIDQVIVVWSRIQEVPTNYHIINMGDFNA